MTIAGILSTDVEFATTLLSVYYPFTEDEIAQFWDVLDRGDAHYSACYSDREEVFCSPHLGLCFNQNIEWNDKLKARWRCGLSDPLNEQIVGLGNGQIISTRDEQYVDFEELTKILPLSLLLEQQELYDWSKFICYPPAYWGTSEFVQEDEPEYFKRIVECIPPLDCEVFRRMFEEYRWIVLLNRSVWENTVLPALCGTEVLNILRLKRAGMDPASHCRVGECYAQGLDGFAKDEKAAVHRFYMAAERGHSQAQYKLGVCYEKGVGIAKDAEQAVQWYYKAAVQGHAEAQYTLGQYYYKGLLLPSLWPKSLSGTEIACEWYRSAAEKGHVDSQYELGHIYADNFVMRNAEEACRWLMNAAKNGHGVAQYRLGLCYLKGTGVNQNVDEAVKWLRNAAEKGIADAQYHLAQCYAQGQVVAVVTDDILLRGLAGNSNFADSMAFKWYLAAAEQGHEGAQEKLGYYYMHGKGVEKNQKAANMWNKKIYTRRKERKEDERRWYIEDMEDLMREVAEELGDPDY